MKHSPDFDFLHTLAEGSNDHEILERIEEDRREIFRRRSAVDESSRARVQPASELLPPLTLCGITLELPRRIAPACADILTEHLRDEVHAAAPGFRGDDADLVVDIGANIGMYTLALARRNPAVEIIAAEPVSETFRTLVGNLGLNNLRLVTAVRTAIGNPPPAPFVHRGDRRRSHDRARMHTGTLCIDLASTVPSVASRSLRSAGPRWLRHVPLTREVVYELRTAELLSLCGTRRISILKIDVEGDEVAVLRGALPALSRVDRVVVEYHGRRRREYCRQLLAACGFQLIAADSGPVGDLYFA